MRYLLSIILILWCSSTWAFPPDFVGMMGSGGAATGGAITCSETPTISQTVGLSGLNFSKYDNTTNGSAGIIINPPSNISLCSIDILISLGAGSLTGKIYKAKVHTLDGSANQSSLVSNGISDAVDGSSSWSSTRVKFKFSSAVQLSTGTTYGISVCTVDGSDNCTVDSTNYAKVLYTGSGAWGDGSLATWVPSTGLIGTNFGETTDLNFLLYEAQ